MKKQNTDKGVGSPTTHPKQKLQCEITNKQWEIGQTSVLTFLIWRDNRNNRGTDSGEPI